MRIKFILFISVTHRAQKRDDQNDHCLGHRATREGIESNSFGTMMVRMMMRRRRTMEIMKMMATRLKTIVLNGPGIMSLSRWLKVNREQ